MGKVKEAFMEMQQEQRETEATGTTSLMPFNTQKLLELNKSDISDLAHATIQGVAEGTDDALRLLILAKKGLELFTIIENNCKHYVYGKQYEKHTIYGAEIEPAALGTKYDFSVCKDSILDRLQAEADKANAAVKDRQNFLKAINGSATLVDTDTGEMYTAYPPVKTQTAGYKITLK